MYSQYGKAPIRIAQNYIKELVPNADNETARLLYDERIRLFEILGICLDISTYLLVLTLKTSLEIDQHVHLHMNDSLIGYGREAMQEMLVIRVRDLFQAEKDNLDRFKLHGFHQILQDRNFIQYPKPNLETNNAIARIIKRRNFYSAKHSTDGKEASLEKNRLDTLDPITAVAYMSKVEENLHGSKAFDPFERLLNDELEADRPLVWDYVYEALTWLPASVEDEGDRDTAEFATYQLSARKEIKKIRGKVQKIIG